MKKYYDNYGIDSEDLDGVAQVISEWLDIPLEADSDSDYGGKYYEHRSKEKGNIKLFLNWDPHFGEWVVWPLRGHAMVLEIANSPRTFEIEEILRGIDEFRFTLLQRSVYDTETKELKRLFSAVGKRQDMG